MARRALIIMAAAGVGCGPDGGQSIDVSQFNEFVFSRTIDIGTCFESGDLISARMRSQAGNRVLDYTTLIVAGDGSDCTLVDPEDHCLVASDLQTRVLVDSENRRIDQLFQHIANAPDVLCAAGNITLCSADTYSWDGLTVSGDFCQPVYVGNGFEVMGLLEALRDGPPSETADDASTTVDAVFATAAVPVLRVLPFVASEQILGKNGDFVVVRTQGDLNGILLQDGSQSIDFAAEIAVAVIIIRAPCQEFLVAEAVESLLAVELHAVLQPREDCGFDLGSIDANLIVIPRTAKPVRLLLNGSQLDEIRL